MSAVRVRGFALPHGDPVDLFADGDRWTTGPVPGADLVAEDAGPGAVSALPGTPARSPATAKK